MTCANRIGRDRAFDEQIRDALETVTLNSVRGVISDEVIRQALDVCGIKYRRRLITPITTVLHMIAAGLWPDDSFMASWQLVWDHMVSLNAPLAGQSPNSGSVAKARARLTEKFWAEIFRQVSCKAQALSGSLDQWRGHRVVLIDGTTVSMSDRADLFEAFGRGRNERGAFKYPVARLVTTALAQSMLLIGYRIGRYDEGEGSLAAALLEGLRAGDILVGDRNFAGANRYAAYRLLGLEFLTRAHQTLNVTRLKAVYRYAAGDFVAELRVRQEHRLADARLPEVVRVRLIKAKLMIRGKKETVWFVTSLLDAKAYPAKEIIELYMWRWRVEGLIRSFKVETGADVLRSQSAQGVRGELVARLVAANIVRTIMLESAIEVGVDPLRISFVGAVRAIVVFAPAFASQPVWKLPQMYRAMLREIAAHLVRERPGRNEPRVVRRDAKHYPIMSMTRAQWRLTNVA